MSAADGPNPREFESWEDAFQHPVPTVRLMEKKLRNGALENKDKLKNLVGASYRDLLGTAHTIIEANSHIQRVDSLLVDVGKRCDSRILSKIAANTQHLQSHIASQDQQHRSTAAQLYLLQQCLNSVARLLRSRSSTLLAAKLLVVSRLLHKVVNLSPQESSLNTIFGKRIVSLRAKLLRHIDRRFEHTYDDMSDLVQDMTAFALATSSAPSDVIRHYQHVRLEAIAKPMRHPGTNFQISVLSNFNKYLNTQREMRMVYPDLLQTSLRTLGARPLLQDPDVWEIDELRLASYIQWISPEVKHFTPWTRYDEVTKSKLIQSLQSWSRAGLDAFISQLSDDVDSETDTQVLVKLRAELLQCWVSNKRHAVGLKSRNVLHRLDELILSRLKELITTSFSALHTALTEPVSESLQSWHQVRTSNKSLWDPATLSLGLSHGAAKLRETVVNQRSGRHENIQSVLRGYQNSLKDIQSCPSIIHEIRNLKWEDDDDSSDSDDAEAGTDSASLLQALSRDDADALQTSLQASAANLVSQVEHYFESQLTSDNIQCTEPSSPGVYVLRVLRELRRNIPVLLRNINEEAAQHLLCPTLVATLYNRLAEAISKNASPVVETALQAYAGSRRTPRSLWDNGSPPLPIQVTPATFQTLRATVKEMEAFGPDIWAPDAAAAVRQALDHTFASVLARVVQNLEDSRTSLPSAPSQALSQKGSDDANGEPMTASSQNAQDANEEAVDAAQDTQSPVVNEQNSAEEDVKAGLPAPPKSATENGRSSVPTVPDAAHEAEVADKLTQLLFDATYLANVLRPQGPAAVGSASGETSAMDQQSLAQSELADQIVSSLVVKTGVDEVALARLQKSAADYWRKTYLLFGLLCG